MLSRPRGGRTVIPGRVLVTGGTGFVGRHLLRRLSAEGVQLRCLVRDRVRAISQGIPADSLAVASLEDAAALEPAVEGVDLVFHVAGTISGLRDRDYFRGNVEGTRNLLAALARKAPAAALVHVSSLSAAGPSVDGAGTDRAPDLCQPCSRYGESKRRGELAVSEGDSRWVILRPPIVYGSGDRATRMLFRQALLPLTPVPWADRPLSVLHVGDLVQAMIAAASGSAWRQILPLEGPDRLSMHQLPRALAAACGRRPRLLRLPHFALRAAATLADLAAGLRGRPSMFSRDKAAEIAAVGWVADPDPARAALDFRPATSSAQGFRETALAEGFAT